MPISQHHATKADQHCMQNQVTVIRKAKRRPSLAAASPCRDVAACDSLCFSVACQTRRPTRLPGDVGVDVDMCDACPRGNRLSHHAWREDAGGRIEPHAMRLES